MCLLLEYIGKFNENILFELSFMVINKIQVEYWKKET